MEGKEELSLAQKMPPFGSLLFGKSNQSILLREKTLLLTELFLPCFLADRVDAVFTSMMLLA
jgi:hypothetical protein